MTKRTIALLLSVAALTGCGTSLAPQPSTPVAGLSAKATPTKTTAATAAAMRQVLDQWEPVFADLKAQADAVAAKKPEAYPAAAEKALRTWLDQNSAFMSDYRRALGDYKKEPELTRAINRYAVDFVTKLEAARKANTPEAWETAMESVLELFLTVRFQVK